LAFVADQHIANWAALFCVALAFAGCAAPLPPDYLRAGPWTPADREMQGRRYEGIGEAGLLSGTFMTRRSTCR
jgi:hypothetical protein